MVKLGEVRLQVAKLRRDPGKSGVELCGCGAEVCWCPLWRSLIDECSVTVTPADDLRLIVRLRREMLGRICFPRREQDSRTREGDGC